MNLIQAYGPSIAPSGVLLDRGTRTRGVDAASIPAGGAFDICRSAAPGSAS